MSQEARRVQKQPDPAHPFGTKDEMLMENIFNIYNQPGASHSHYNILSKIDFAPTVAKGNYTLYYTSPQDTWPLISYKHYNNIKMWWIIASLNSIDNTFLPPSAGMRLKIPTPSAIRDIIDSIKVSTM